MPGVVATYDVYPDKHEIEVEYLPEATEEAYRRMAYGF